MLRASIIASGLSREQFAAKAGISRSYLSLLEAGKKQPSLEVAVRIERLTSGAVLAASWVPEEPQAREAAE